LFNEVFEDSDILFNQTNGFGDGVKSVGSVGSSVGVGFSFVIAELDSSGKFDVLLSGSFFLFVSFGGGVINSLGEGGNFVLEVFDLRFGFVVEVNLSFSGGGVFFNPGFVFSSFDFSGFGDSFQKGVDQGEDLSDGSGVSLDGGGGGDLGEEFENVVPGLSLEVLGVGLEVFGNLDQSLGFEVLLEERSGESVFNNFLGSFDDVGGSVVFLLFGSPVSVVFGLVCVEFDYSITGFG